MYEPAALPYSLRKLPDGQILGISESGDHAFLTSDEVVHLENAPAKLPIERQAELKARFFLTSSGKSIGTRRLLVSRKAAKRETVQVGPALHAIVPTLLCEHSCRYCQVSRSLEEIGHTISVSDLDAASDAVFESRAPTLTVEYQGGDPLLRFDLVRRSIERIAAKNSTEKRSIRFVVASTLHQLTPEMCEFFRQHRVFLSTSIDGPSDLHNKNRPTPARDAYERTIAGIELARSLLGAGSVSALMTTTKESLRRPEEIVDEYVRLGFHDIFLRPLSAYGFAKRNQAVLGYQQAEFQQFYLKALERVIHWNRQGIPLREVYASIILNKVLSTFDSGYVDLQSPSGAGLSALVYNYDGYVYPADEARMLAETGDKSLRLGRIGASLKALLESETQRQLVRASLTDYTPGCRECPYRLFCAPNPVDAKAQFGDMRAPVLMTEHCQRHMWLFDTFFMKIKAAEPWLLDVFYEWAAPPECEAQ
ncbi:His-Xaa-Ser system radical SAM maturase HxsB [Noviherbaspirillum autotrophicum]|uniref:Radical SAM protein n=1 Tax=Noviherbaspirillum autotrophicum TaxID=709839 RepID=A0A0C2BSL3_9BURK|nr:His-Xaa-Ser system radical SAM maturase HxsB [Noviherbaspirillum autotrophicum]KIF83054.1 radical SAM protein [Noviherbaspirillum autotrophicum]